MAQIFDYEEIDGFLVICQNFSYKIIITSIASYNQCSASHNFINILFVKFFSMQIHEYFPFQKFAACSRYTLLTCSLAIDSKIYCLSYNYIRVFSI